MQNKVLTYSIMFERTPRGKGKVDVVLYGRRGVCNPIHEIRKVLETLT